MRPIRARNNNDKGDNNDSISDGDDDNVNF